jgi:hypothetical protein
MKNAIPVSTTTATSAISIAFVPLRPEPPVEVPVVWTTVGVVVVLGTVAGEIGTPGENGLVVSGTAGVLEDPVEVPPAASAVAGPKAGNAMIATTATRDVSRRLTLTLPTLKS